MKQNSSSASAQTVGRAALLLRLIASNQTRSLRLVDIASMAALDKSTAHRLLQRLVHERMLVRDPVRGYRLGPLLYELGLATLPETNLREMSRTALGTLAQATGDMVFLLGRSGFETVCLSRIAGNYPIQTMMRTEGDRHPLGVGAGGMAILAALSDADVNIAIDAVAARLQSYQLSKEQLFAAVVATRRHNGFAIDEGSAALGVTAIGRAIHGRCHTTIAAIVVASISARMSQDRRRLICKQLLTCTESVACAIQ